MVKFRTMRTDAEAASGPVWTTEARSAGDARGPVPAAVSAWTSCPSCGTCCGGT